MHHSGACLAKGNQLPLRRCNWFVFGLSEGGFARRFAFEAKALFRPASLLWFFTAFQKIDKITAKDQAWPSIIERWQAIFEPAANGAFGDTLINCNLFSRIGAVDFHHAPARAPRHSFCPAFNECADVLNTPSRYSGAEFDRLGITPCLDTGPPCGLANRNGPVGRDDGWKAQEACCWQFKLV